MPISAIDSIPLAFQHTKRQLLQPFRFGQWWRLALVGFLAGELGSGGGVNFPTNFNLPQTPHSRHFLGAGLPSIDPALMGGAVAVLILAAAVFVLLFMYVGSVMRFILFDSVLVKECRIREGWGRNHGRGLRYFFFKLVYVAATLFVMVVLIGIPAGIVFAMGWFKEPGDHVLGFVLGGIVLFFLFMIFVVGSAVFYVMTKDFVVPQMAFENIGVLEGWRRLWPMLEVEKGGYAAYIGIKIAMAIGAGIVVGIATVILALFIAIPAILFGVLAAVTGKSAGLTWDVYTVTIAVVVGLVLFGIFMYLISLLSVPVIVFFPAYAMYFFAPRYRALSLALYPPPPAPAGAAYIPPASTQEPPPLMPGTIPDPIG